MSIEQHAEAAANDIVSRLDGCGLDSVDTRRFAEIIQSAIDEATAPLRARIAELEGLGPLIEEYGEACAVAELAKVSYQILSGRQRVGRLWLYSRTEVAW